MKTLNRLPKKEPKMLIGLVIPDDKQSELDIKINGDSGQYIFVSSSKFSVERALTLKSVNGIVFAKSWEGCAAACMISLIDFLYLINIFSKSE